MATLQELIKSTVKFKSTLFTSSDRITTKAVKITRQAGVRTVLFSGQSVDSESSGGRSVQVNFIVPRGVDVKTYVPSISDDRVQVRSSSPWYRFAFQYNNQKIGAHFGRVHSFTVKGTGRPVNPDNYPGLDKHLIGFVRALHGEGLIRD